MKAKVIGKKAKAERAVSNREEREFCRNVPKDLRGYSKDKYVLWVKGKPYMWRQKLLDGKPGWETSKELLAGLRHLAQRAIPTPTFQYTHALLGVNGEVVGSRVCNATATTITA